MSDTIEQRTRTGVRCCLIVLATPTALGLGALAGRLAVGIEGTAGALALLLAAGVGAGLFLAAYDWVLDAVAARLTVAALARRAAAPEPPLPVYPRAEPTLDAWFRARP